MKEYKAGIYLRLSKEDIENNNSIDMQRQITTNYAMEHGYNIVKEYVDNGFSGVMTQRPGLDKLIVDIARGNINMLIVKDTSRLTRDKNMTSYYTDIFFPENDIRFISVTEYVDTGERYDIDDIIALKGVVNQSYVEDLSNKIKAVKRNLREQGKYIEWSVAYGYKKSKEDKNKIEIDEKVAQVVREIYRLYLQGTMPVQIVEILNNNKVMTPSQYLKLKRRSDQWDKNTINRILNNPIYTGCRVLNKYDTNIKLKRRTSAKKKEYQLIENTHDAIITREDYEKVQKLKAKRDCNTGNKHIYILRDLVYCKECGRKLTYKNKKPVIMDKDGNIQGEYNNNGYFVCDKHFKIDKSYKIMENTLNRLVLERSSTRLKELQIEKYYKDIKKKIERQDPQLNMENKIKKEIKKNEAKLKVHYSKKVEEIISEEEFRLKYAEYNKRREKLNEELNIATKKPSLYKVDNEIKKTIMEFEKGNKMDNIVIKKLVEKVEVGKYNKIVITLKV